jgi:hypothetical protein
LWRLADAEETFHRVDLLLVHGPQDATEADEGRLACGPVSLTPVSGQFAAGGEPQLAVVAWAGVWRSHCRCPFLIVSSDSLHVAGPGGGRRRADPAHPRTGTLRTVTGPGRHPKVGMPVESSAAASGTTVPPTRMPFGLTTTESPRRPRWGPSRARRLAGWPSGTAVVPGPVEQLTARDREVLEEARQPPSREARRDPLARRPGPIPGGTVMPGPGRRHRRAS